MTDTIKILAQAQPTTAALFYTVPSLSVTTTSSFIACNRTGNTPTFSIAVIPSGTDISGSIPLEHYIYFNKGMTANETFSAVLGMTMEEGDFIMASASAAEISFTLFGVETS